VGGRGAGAVVWWRRCVLWCGWRAQ